MTKAIGSNIIHWNNLPKDFKYAPKEETILLFGGLTPQRERLLQAAAASVGEHYSYLPNPDIKSFELGKIYGNKAQCNPIYFTVGNLIKYLIYLRDEKKIPVKEIIRRYIHITVSGCGPCRFGMYITEYKKALADAGFEGFRVVSFDHEGSIFQESTQEIVKFSPKFFIILIKTALIADILTLLGDHMRAYEVKKGSVNEALKSCEDKIIEALHNKKNLTLTLFECRKILSKVALNKAQVKPKVMVMGEFWAAMTRSEGNYHIHSFLENEGAEVISQPLINRILLNIWDAQYQNKKRAKIATKEGFDFENVKMGLYLTLLKRYIRFYFKLYSKAIGLNSYELDDMDYLYEIAKSYYNVDSNGGEGHLEVAHLLENIEHKKAHLIISLKPFGCMPSSGVSDGVVSLILAKYPQLNFLSLETSGESATNFYSRIQMALFKAKEEAKIEAAKFNIKTFPEFANKYSFYPKSKYIGTAAKIMDYLKGKK